MIRINDRKTDALDLIEGRVTVSHRDMIFPMLQMIFSRETRFQSGPR